MTHVYILPLLTCLQNVYLHSPMTRTSPVQKDHFHDIGIPVTHSCRAYVSIAVKTKLAVVQSCVYLMNIII